MGTTHNAPKEPDAISPGYRDLPRDPTTNRPVLPPRAPHIKTKGMSGRLNEEQREFARRVLTRGKEGGQEEYEANLRRRMLAGILAPQLEILVLHYMYGKPAETVVVKNKVPKGSPLGELSAEELRLRALAVAQQIVEARTQAESADGDQGDDTDNDDAIH
jgi:hypothetical protein